MLTWFKNFLITPMKFQYGQLTGKIKTPEDILSFSISNDSQVLFDRSIQLGANVKVKNGKPPFNLEPLHRAIHNRNYSMAERLIENGAYDQTLVRKMLDEKKTFPLSPGTKISFANLILTKVNNVNDEFKSYLDQIIKESQKKANFTESYSKTIANITSYKTTASNLTPKNAAHPALEVNASILNQKINSIHKLRTKEEIQGDLNKLVNSIYKEIPKLENHKKEVLIYIQRLIDKIYSKASTDDAETLMTFLNEAQISGANLDPNEKQSLIKIILEQRQLDTILSKNSVKEQLSIVENSPVRMNLRVAINSAINQMRANNGELENTPKSNKFSQ